MTRVLALPRYTLKGASSRLRTLQYIGELAGRGIEIRLESLLDDVYLSDLYAGRGTQWNRVIKAYSRRASLRGLVRSFDVVWLEKEAFPWLPAAAERWLIGRDSDWWSTTTTRSFIGMTSTDRVGFEARSETRSMR